MKLSEAIAILSLLLIPESTTLAAAPTLDPAFCQALVKHVPDADVDYRPGVDVNGNPVVPADRTQPYAREAEEDWDKERIASL